MRRRGGLPPWLLAAWPLGSALLGATTASCGDDGDPTSGSGGGTSASSTGMASTATGTGGATSSSGAGGDTALPETFTVTGVVTDGVAPVEGAMVLQGGGEVQQVTGPDGTFAVEMTTSLPGTPVLVAGKIGHRAGWEEIFELPDGPVELVLLAAEPPDDVSYVYGPPGVGDMAEDTSTAVCGHCHTTFVATFQGTAHQRATSDPWVQDLYAGVASARDDAECEEVGGVVRPGKVPGTEDGREDRCYVGDGVLPDLNGCGDAGEPACDDPDLAGDDRPDAFGGCADCHGAGMDGPAGGRDLLEATGLAFEQGNHCDVCHHVRDIDLDAPPGTAGRLVLQRPRERVSDEPGAAVRQVMFGPLLDVPNAFMGGSFQPVFMEAAFCAGCHEQQQDALVPGTSLDRDRWPDGLPTHSTFAEWGESDAAASGQPCQGCHMPPITGMFNSVDVADPSTAGLSSGFGRPPERNRSHAFLGALEGNPRMLDRALVVSMTAAPGAEPGTFTVSVDLDNIGAGHAVPTGEPMRSLLLVLDARACGEAAVGVAGSSIGDTGGALAQGVVGDAIDADGSWPDGAARATVGARVRVTRPTGGFLDYPGVGRFADPSLNAEDKGIPVRVPVADVEVVDVVGDVLVTEPPLDLLAGDVLWLGEPPDLREGAVAAAIAGLPGQDFARVTVDATGRRHVPHHRAVDLASDHRIPPSGSVTSEHAFRVPDGCADASVTATVVYRRAPVELARERAWDGREHVITAVTRSVSLR